MPKRFVLKRVRDKHVRNEYREISEESENKIKRNEEMENNKLKEAERIMNDINGTKLPKRKVKIDKKDKGLIERTENSTILITEDNKLMLND